MPGEVHRLAAAYAEHLLAGGVTTWAEFLPGAAPVSGDPDPVWLREPPGASQAELLRRLNRRAGPSAARHRDLAERVLRRAAPGRGLVDLRLTDPPRQVPVAELLRLAAGVLADLLAELPTGAAGTDVGGPAGASPPAYDRRAPSYRLEGPPLTVAALRRRLVAAGLPPRGGRRWRLRRRRPDVVLVVALPLRRALFEVWSRRVQRGGTKSWPGLLTEWHTNRRLPAAAAYDRLAAGWARRIGAARVHVVTGDDLDRQVEEVLGRPPAPYARPRAGARALTPVLVDVVRRTSEVLTFRVPPGTKQQRLDLLVALLAEPEPGGRAAARIPPGRRRWLARTGRRAAAQLTSGEFVVHGSVRSLGRPGRPARPPGDRDRALLGAMVGSVLRVDAARAATTRVGTDGGRGSGA